MPTYEYRCVSCEHQFERFQRMSDDPVTECEVCGQAVKRLLFPVAIHFKGSGFYSTDYAKRHTIGAGNGSSASGSAEQSSAESGSASSASSNGGSEKSGHDDKPAEKSSAKPAERAPVAAKTD